MGKIADKGRDFFYMNPSMHLDSNKELYIEKCKRIEEYNEVFIRLKSNGLYIQVWGSKLKASDFKTDGLVIKGKIEQIELIEKK